MITWIVAVALLGGLCLGLYFRLGPRQAIAAAALLGLLVPQWVRWEIDSSVWFNVQTTVTVAMLVMYCFHSQATFNFRLGLCDWALGAMMAVHIASDVVNDGFELSVLLRAYGEWYMPYIAGRLAFQSTNDVRWAMLLAAVVALLFALQGVLESVLFLRTNVFEFLVLQERPVPPGIPSNAENASRWGFKRAYGPLMHTLYYGVVQVILMPWLLYASHRLMSKRSDEAEGKGWLWAIPITAVGVASSLSRGPFLAIGPIIYCMHWALTPRHRFALSVVGVVGIAATLFISGPLLDQLDVLTGEDLAGTTTRSREGEVKYTSASARWLLFEVYGHPMKLAGPLGFGTENCSTFPPRVPYNQELGRVRTVDNAYILFTLRFGYLGLLAFVAVNAAAAWQFLSLADKSSGTIKIWLAASAAMVVTTMLMFMLVWMPQDIGFIYLFSLGASSGLVIDDKRPRKPEQRRRRRSSSSRQQEPEPPMKLVGGDW